jgi:hypothetical protein
MQRGDSTCVASLFCRIFRNLFLAFVRLLILTNASLEFGLVALPRHGRSVDGSWILLAYVRLWHQSGRTMQDTTSVQPWRLEGRPGYFEQRYQSMMGSDWAVT